MPPQVPQTTYNLIEEKWIPVLYRNGKTDRVGIWQALTDAGKIRQIAASNPMDRVALLRFLLAVLMWCKEDAKSSLAALDKKSAGVPEDWLGKLEEHKAAFNLLGDSKRFYQDDSVKNNKARPIADLLVEFPGEDSVNHMRHVVHDGSYGFCPACCALGILRVSVWAPANRFYPASVNPGSAAYAVVKGRNLIETLRENLPDSNTQTDLAPWLCSEQPN
jgi:CRISPR system Cascade subunit CasA